MAAQGNYPGYAPPQVTPAPSWGGGGGSTPWSNSGYAQAPRPGMAYVDPWSQEAAASYFTDPLSQPIMQSWSARMGSLQPGNAPNLSGIEDLYRHAAQPNAYYQKAGDSLSSLINDRAGASNQYTPQYASNTAERIKQLKQDPFSTSDDAALKARYFDSLSASRDDRAQQMAQMLAGRGFGNASGLAADAMSGVENAYQSDRAQQQQQLLQYVMDQREARRNLAVQMSGGLADQGYKDATLAAQNLSARGSVAGALAALAAAQQNAEMAAAGGIGGLRQQDFANRQGLYDQQLATSMLPYTLNNQRLQNLTSMLGGVPNALQGVNQTMQNQNQQQAYNAQQNQAMWTGIGGAVQSYPWNPQPQYGNYYYPGSQYPVTMIPPQKG